MADACVEHFGEDFVAAWNWDWVVCFELDRAFTANSNSDPWWIFTTISLFYTIKKEYNFGLWELVVVSPRFGIMLASMCLSIAFLIVDTLSVTNVFSDALPTGIEPFWKVRPQHPLHKCLCLCNLSHTHTHSLSTRLPSTFHSSG